MIINVAFIFNRSNTFWRYEVSDDFVMDTILSGAYGAKSDVWGIFLTVLFVSFFSDDLYLLVQFTKTATVCIMAGELLLLYSYWNIKSKKKYLAGAFGIVLCLIGAMVRSACINMVLPFLVLVYIGIVIKQKFDKKLMVKAALGVALCGLVVLGAYKLWDVDSYLWSRYPEYQKYRVKNAQRASITDIGGYDGQAVLDKIAQMEGCTIEDYFTLISWNFVDQSVYTPERLGEFAQVFHTDANQANHSIKNIILALKDRHYERYTVVWAIIITLAFRKTKGWYAIIDIGLVLGLLGYLEYSGRILYRVEYGIFFCMAVVFLWQLMSAENMQEIKLGRLAMVLTVLLIAAKIPLYIPNTSYKTMSADEYNQYVYDVFYESWNFKLEKYRACVNKRPVYDELITQMENDSEHYYLCDFSSTIQLLYYHYKPWLRLPIGYYRDTYSYLGGVTTYYPSCHETWAYNGLDYYNPYSTIANDNILIVDNYYQLTKINYYKQYYDAEAEEELVGTCGYFNIWKIRP